jgi:hypothetical protein
MGKLLLYACGICFIVITVVGLVQDVGAGWLLGLLKIVGGLVALGLVLAVASAVYAAPEWRRLHTREAIAKAEAGLGIPVPTAGACSACGRPLVVGATFCSFCRQPVSEVAAEPLLCPTCKTRQLDDAHWCSACGADLTPATATSAEAKQAKEPAPAPATA